MLFVAIMRDRGATIGLLLILCLVLSTLSFPLASASSELWSQTYGGTSNDSAEDIVQTSDGGYAIAGYTSSFGAGDSDFWLVKTDSNGNMQWNKTYGGAKSDIAYSLVETSDGGYALAGYTNSFSVRLRDFWLVKADQYGNMEWNQTYGGRGMDTARSLVETSDGGYALAGETGSFGSGNPNFWLVKTDSYGNVEWNQTYGGAQGTTNNAHSLVETSDGGYAMAGYIGTPHLVTYWVNYRIDFCLVKTDQYGNEEWNQTYSRTNYDAALSLVETSDGGYALVGETQSVDAGPSPYEGVEDYDVWLVKTDKYGYVEWNRTYGGANNDIAFSLVEPSDGGYAFAGETYSFDVGLGDFWLVKTDAYGNMEWNQTYGGADSEIVRSLVEVSGGGFALAGYTDSLGAGDYDFCFVKTDEYGIIPEFPSWTILPILLVSTLAVIVIRNKLGKKGLE